MTTGNFSPTHGTDAARRQLERVLQRQREIATELRAHANDATGPRRRQLRDLSRRFSRSMTAEELLRHPDALAICMPFLRSPPASTSDDGGGETTSVANAVREGSQWLSEGSSTRSHVLRLLLYPLMVLVLAFALLVAASLTLVPEFERIYQGYGLDPSGLTALVIQVSHVIQWLWLPGCVVLLVALSCLAAVAMARRFGGSPTAESRWFGRMMVSARASWARWAWHVAMLLESGVPQSEAIRIAGESSSKPALRRWSETLSGQLRSGTEPVLPLEVGGSTIGTLAFALGLTDRWGQIDLLRDVAANGWDRDRNQSLWWVAWVTPVTVWMVGALVGLVVIALYAPLIELINGLT